MDDQYGTSCRAQLQNTPVIALLTKELSTPVVMFPGRFK
jgi:hypothetical protein